MQEEPICFPFPFMPKKRISIYEKDFLQISKVRDPVGALTCDPPESLAAYVYETYRTGASDNIWLVGCCCVVRKHGTYLFYRGSVGYT